MAESYSLSVAASCASATSGAGQFVVACHYSYTGPAGHTPAEIPTTLYLCDAQGNRLEDQPAGRGSQNSFPNLPDASYELQWRQTDDDALLASQPAALNCAGQTGGGGGGSGSGGGSGGGGGSTPVVGCQDEYATDYDPTATQAGSCSYSVNWRSAWGPEGVAVRVAAVAGQVEAFVTATLRAGFRDGHPLAAERPLADVATLRATVGPDGYATFILGPYLRPLLGAADGAGGYRYDLNSATAYGADLYVGYELRRTTGELLEHGYALNAAVPDSWLPSSGRLSPFEVLPLWSGFDDYRLPLVTDYNLSQYGELLNEAAGYLTPTTRLPCPPNPLPVAWLAPGGGYGYWVLQGKTQLTDAVSDGQQYQEALTGELRYSERGASRRTYQASSGVFKGPGLAEGLATLWRSPQVWLQPVVGGPWVPVTIGSGEFPVRRIGVLRIEFTITFTEAAAQYAQGQ